MNSTARHQMGPEWHLFQPRLGLLTLEWGGEGGGYNINGSGSFSDAL